MSRVRNPAERALQMLALESQVSFAVSGPFNGLVCVSAAIIDTHNDNTRGKVPHNDNLAVLEHRERPQPRDVALDERELLFDLL